MASSSGSFVVHPSFMAHHQSVMVHFWEIGTEIGGPKPQKASKTEAPRAMAGNPWPGEILENRDRKTTV
jgi:hypothetical protein